MRYVRLKQIGCLYLTAAAAFLWLAALAAQIQGATAGLEEVFERTV
jgi:hypothetical protein